MQKLNKIFQYLYLIIAIVFFIDAAVTFSSNKTKALLLAAFAVMAVMMFFLKRKISKGHYPNK